MHISQFPLPSRPPMAPSGLKQEADGELYFSIGRGRMPVAPVRSRVTSYMLFHTFDIRQDGQHVARKCNTNGRPREWACHVCGAI